MKSCRKLQALFARVAEGEAGPEEALRVARHLSECTTCKIVLAREKRLAEMLCHLDDPLTVEAGFIDRVMAALPAGPPPARSPRRRMLKLAGFAGAALALIPSAIRLLGSAPGGALDSFRPVFELDGVDRLLGGLGVTARALLLMLARSGAGALPRLPSLGGVSTSPWTVVLSAAMLLAIAAFLGVTTWTVSRRSSRAGAAPGLAEPRH